ncbi:MAG: PBSX family phage terminase large subunit [Eubacteriales bacterium]|nr:PBSX family phage terminase large subunit [Eubacteriales bacterium]
MNLEIPEKLIPLFQTDKRYIDIYGGRGSAKSWTVADFLLAKGKERKRRILCSREIQNSIRDSVHKLLSDKILNHKLDYFYNIQKDRIIGKNETEFIFKGLHHNEQDIKSTEGIDIAWVEEAHSVSRKSLETLTPTIRNDNSQIIFTYNPTNMDDPIHVDYTLTERNDTLKININYNDNPWFPQVLKAEMEYDRGNDPDKYAHKWLGQCIQHSDAQIYYGKWKIEDFEAPEGIQFYYGADFGFSQDPSCLLRCYIKNNCLYIDYEVVGYGTDIDKLPELFSHVPLAKVNYITADSSRPETINYLRRNGYPKIKSSVKGTGSIEEGISHIRSFEKIVIHSRCKNVIDEMRLYCYKVDRLTGLATTVPDDKHNHLQDSLRYALEDIMRNKQGNKIIVQGW